MHLARGGAVSVLAVDSSEPALALARANVERNGLSDQVQFLNQFEQQIGMGIWYDY